MDSRDQRPYWSSDGQPRLRRYIVQATKAVLCVTCWVGICALLLLYGPQAMTVPSVPSRASEVVTAILGVLLSAGSATVLTIILSVFVLGAISWNRDQTGDPQDDTETMEDESHA